MENKTTTEIERAKAWDFALGLLQMDGLVPSEDFLKLVDQEKSGSITTQEIKNYLNHKYQMKAD